MKFLFKIPFILLLVALCLLLTTCETNTPVPQQAPTNAVFFDLDSIKLRGKIILLTENSASTYFLYRNQERGFDYEMMRAFAKHLDVKLEVKLLDDVDVMFEMLNRGEGDVIASNLTVTPRRKQIVNFSTPVYQTRQVLAQRKYPTSVSDSTIILVRDSSQLHTIPIWVHEYSSFYERLKELELQTGQTLNIEIAPGEMSTDDLLRLTDSGEIPATITDENLAMMEQEDYADLDASMAITGKQNIAWATRINAPKLIAAMNQWLAKEKTRDKLTDTYKKYFRETETKAYPNMKWTLPTLPAGAISPYDSLFKLHAPSLGWDWRMLAAMAFQESRFNPHAQSWSGAYGLMQLMPETAMRFGCDSAPAPECSVKAATQYLKYLQNMWKKRVPNAAERTKFILASYNIGQGHIIDAQNLAHELGMQDTLWDGHVAEALLFKQQEKYYSMPCVKHGYCHAKEPFHFVGKIMALFEHYKSAGK
ncbi:MAG: transporter substrate-binding domain-containing protein [Flavobacteriales bacterium]